MPIAWFIRPAYPPKPSRCPGPSPIGSIHRILSASCDLALKSTRRTDARGGQSSSSDGSDGRPRQRRVLRWTGVEGKGREIHRSGRGLRHPDVQKWSRSLCLQVRVTPIHTNVNLAQPDGSKPSLLDLVSRVLSYSKGNRNMMPITTR